MATIQILLHLGSGMPCAYVQKLSAFLVLFQTITACFSLSLTLCVSFFPTS